MAKIGAALGADVPFFLPAGRRLERDWNRHLPARRRSRPSLLILCGRQGLDCRGLQFTQRPALTMTGSAAILPVSYADAQILASLYDVMRNDFEPVIYNLYPEIERARTALAKAGAGKALLAGSGACVFGVFNDRESSARARGALRVEAGWQVFTCATVSRETYRRALGGGAEQAGNWGVAKW